MSSSARSLWLRWKSLRLPWRKKYLVGADLQGNTYWEFKNSLGTDPNRMRRIVQASRKTHHSDVQVSPQWHQWLRHTRDPPPTIEEQQTDVVRQIQLKENARLADARWASKKKYIESPSTQERQGGHQGMRLTMGGNQDEPGSTSGTIAGGDAPKTEPAAKEGVRQGVASNAEQAAGHDQPDPWVVERQREQAKARSPGGAWQPDSWAPPPGTRRG